MLPVTLVISIAGGNCKILFKNVQKEENCCNKVTFPPGSLTSGATRIISDIRWEGKCYARLCVGGHEDTRISPHTGATQAASNLRIEARHPGAGAFPETGARLDAEAPPSPPLWSARGWGQCSVRVMVFPGGVMWSWRVGVTVTRRRGLSN